MDKPREYYGQWNKSVRKRQIPYDFIYMWNLKNYTNKIETVIESRLMVARGEGIWGIGILGKKDDGINKYKLVITE